MQRKARKSTGSGRAATPLKPLGDSLEKVLTAIKRYPGIRPSELNRLLGVEQSDSWRAALLARGLIRKVKEGSAMRYYAVEERKR
jgi:uncharacterized membrane protein